MKQAEAAEVFVMAQIWKSFFDFVLRVKTQNECSWTHHAPSKATGSLMFLSHWSSYLFELQVMWCQRLLTIFRFSNCHYYQPPREKNGGGEIYKLNSVYSIENLMEKKKFYPRKISIFVLQLHRVAFCLDELECAPLWDRKFTGLSSHFKGYTHTFTWTWFWTGSQ